MAETPVIRVKIIFLRRDEGGRAALPDLSSGQYMPHLVVQRPDVRTATVVQGHGVVDDHLGVRFVLGPKEPLPGQLMECEIELMYHPTVNYEALREGATFTVREGAKVIGFGTVSFVGQAVPAD